MSSACSYPRVVTPADLSCLTFENKSHNENKEVENGVINNKRQRYERKLQMLSEF